jgi:hypothetical protein
MEFGGKEEKHAKAEPDSNSGNSRILKASTAEASLLTVLRCVI